MSPAAALAECPAASWPPLAEASDGRRLGLAGALGPGGGAVHRLLSRLVASHPPAHDWDPVFSPLALATPLGMMDLPVAVVTREEAVEWSAALPDRFLAGLDERRSEPRPQLVAAGREVELEAALHVAMLLAAELLDPRDDEDAAAHAASGAQLWLLAGAVTWCLWAEHHPYAAWAELVARGWWPVGPSGGRLLVAPGAGADSS